MLGVRPAENLGITMNYLVFELVEAFEKEVIDFTHDLHPTRDELRVRHRRG